MIHAKGVTVSTTPDGWVDVDLGSRVVIRMDWIGALHLGSMLAQASVAAARTLEVEPGTWHRVALEARDHAE